MSVLFRRKRVRYVSIIAQHTENGQAIFLPAMFHTLKTESCPKFSYTLLMCDNIGLVKKMTKNAQLKNDLLVAKEMSRYEDKWVGISKTGGREKVVSSGNRITEAKAEADKKGIKDVTYRKVPSSKKVLIAAVNAF